MEEESRAEELDLSSQWSDAAECVGKFLRRARRSQCSKDMKDMKALYDFWRVFVIAIRCLKEIQAGRIQSLLEAHREDKNDANDEDGKTTEEFTRRMEHLLAEIQREEDDEESGEDS